MQQLIRPIIQAILGDSEQVLHRTTSPLHIAIFPSVLTILQGLDSLHIASRVYISLS